MSFQPYNAVVMPYGPEYPFSSAERAEAKAIPSLAKDWQPVRSAYAELEKRQKENIETSGDVWERVASRGTPAITLIDFTNNLIDKSMNQPEPDETMIQFASGLQRAATGNEDIRRKAPNLPLQEALYFPTYLRGFMADIDRLVEAQGGTEKDDKAFANVRMYWHTAQNE